MTMSILRLVAAAMAGLVLAACGGGGGTSPTATPAPTQTPTESAEPTPPGPSQPGTIRVAYLNLMAPLDIDDDQEAAHALFEPRLEIAIRELRLAGADLIGVSEAAWVEGLGQSAWARLAFGLQLEGTRLARANPWYLGHSDEENEALVESTGFEEGEYLLSRYPILESTAYTLPPLTLSEGRAVLHAVVKAPDPLGEIDVYVTRFGGDDAKLLRQAEELLTIIARTHNPEREVIVMGDFGAAPGSDVLRLLAGAGYIDPLAGQELALTCCREVVQIAGSDLTPTATPTPDPEETPDPESTPAPPEPDPVAVTTRTDYILTPRWSVGGWWLIAADPIEQSDGQVLWASDHNGIGVEFTVGSSETVASP